MDERFVLGGRHRHIPRQDDLFGGGRSRGRGARGSIRHIGDFAGQCNYAYDKIKRLLAMLGATMNDVVKIVTYVTDIPNLSEAGKCRTEAQLDEFCD